MRFDLEIVREILLEAERTTPAYQYENFRLGSYPPEVTDYHVKKLKEAGFLYAEFMLKDPPQAVVIELTFQGHQFLDTIRSNGVWQRIKKKVATEGGSLPFEVIRPLALGILKERIGLLAE